MLTDLKRSYAMKKITLTCIALLGSICFLSGQLNRLIQTEPGAHAHFGKRLAINQSNLLIAASSFSVPGASRSGRVYWFELNGKIWTGGTPIPVNSLRAYDQFGYDLSIYENTLAVSAPGSGEGKVFLYELKNQAWQLSQEITIPMEHRKLGLNFNFGQNIHLYGDWLAVSTPGYPAGDSIHIQTGVVFVFKKENRSWTFKQKINPLVLNDHTLFGYDLALTDSCLAVCAPVADGGAPESGVVYLYTLVNGSWVSDFTLIDPASRSGELFGNDIDMVQNRIAI